MVKEDHQKSKQEEEAWSRLPFCAHIVKVRNWCVTGMHPMGSRDTSARSASEAIGKIQHLVDIQKNARKRYCVRIKSVVVCVELRDHLVFHAIRSSNGLKKVAELPPLSETLVKPDVNDPESTTME